MNDKIDHVVVLMLENRSFDCLLGGLNPASGGFDGLTGQEFNPYTLPNGSVERVASWNHRTPEPGLMTIPTRIPASCSAISTSSCLAAAAPPICGRRARNIVSFLSRLA